MRSLGIDLASNPQKTGFAQVRWKDDGAVLEALGVGADDARLLELHQEAQATGIDCPFGWPRDFVRFVADHARPNEEAPPPWSEERRDRLRYRQTDRVVYDRCRSWPLSVSSDLLAVPMFRCLGLLHRMGVEDRSGDGRVFETYPAAALRSWGLWRKSYKNAPNRATLRLLVDEFRERLPGLEIEQEFLDLLKKKDDAFDALVASVIARIAWMDHQGPSEPLTRRPTTDERQIARDEGWIVLPVAEALDRISSGS